MDNLEVFVLLDHLSIFIWCSAVPVASFESGL